MTLYQIHMHFQSRSKVNTLFVKFDEIRNEIEQMSKSNNRCFDDELSAFCNVQNIGYIASDLIGGYNFSLKN